MKISNVRVRLAEVHDADGATLAAARQPKTRQVVAVQVEAGGIEGLGVGFLHGGLTAALLSATEELAGQLPGADAARPEAIAAQLMRHVYKLEDVGLFRVGLSAIDMACWDIIGKAAGLPLWKLLGGARSSIPAYSSGQLHRGLTDEVLAESAAKIAADGFRHAKLHLALPGGHDPAREVARARIAREALGPDVRLQVDANELWSVHEAVDTGHQLQEAGIRLSILEDPVRYTDFAGLARVTDALAAPVMAGESNWGVAPFEHMIRHRSVDILMVDIMQAGGFTAWRKIAAMAEGANLPVVSHLLPELQAHAVAAVPNGLICEYKEWLWPLFDGLPEFRDGCFHLSERPGHGLGLSPEFRDLF
ncbi:mandelate racemase/muconate lactonizing enzyme family protein [Poseidonocella sp. HB161398]|uniref:mandelate racemase/muconate lactonizing enzyme family protein n=1 Tax=Poseidonocella sp. HB161398 TaxID=2320855 RepID=UPI001487555B|nr:mandelate racemase/muconate lactonizing enzyme family protein [Poseidonocella sp. HB161398]